MAEHNKGTKHYSMSAADRRAAGSARISTTIDVELEKVVRERCAERKIKLAAAIDEALRAWVERCAECGEPSGSGHLISCSVGHREAKDIPE